jgi:hypothetical protein
VTSSIDTVSSQVLGEQLREQAEVVCHVASASMLPFVRRRDAVRVRKVPVECLRPGDIILFSRHGELYLHRLLAKLPCADGLCLQLKGDANPAFDPLISAQQYQGKAVCLTRGSSCFDLETQRWRRLNRLIAFISLAEGRFYQLLRICKKKICRQ